MLHRTDGIILHTVKYAESNIIAKVYTSEFGLQSYMISGVRGKKSKHKSALLQPLSLVSLIVSNSGKGGLQRITEINLLQPYTDIPYNVIKSSIIIFLNEILYKVLKEEHADQDMFEYIKNALLILDLKQESCSNFHIYFMTQLSRYLGFAPQEATGPQHLFFDLKEGRFLPVVPSHSHYLSSANSRLFQEFMHAGFENFHLLKTDRLQRKELLQGLILYYQFHITAFGEIKSLSILEEIAA
jgi:DNA repair protein RecO (recombination protein O)